MEAYLEGSKVAPVVRLVFGYTERHASTGELLRDWVRTLPEATYTGESWTVTCFGSDPDGMLRTAGFELGQSISQLAIPAAAMVDGDPDGFAALYPRLAGLAATRNRLSADAYLWDETNRCWRTHPSTLFPAGVPVPWAVVGRSVKDWAAANPDASHAPVQGIPPLRFDGTVDGLRGVPVTDLSAVSATDAEAMAACGIHTVHDLLHTVPLRYLDMANPVPVNDADPGVQVAVLGTVTKVTPADERGTVKATMKDAEGTFVFGRWFNGRTVARRLRVGSRVVWLGKVEAFAFSDGRPGYSMSNPIMEVVPDADVASGRVIGVYRQSGKNQLSTWQVHRAAAEACRRMGNITDPVAPQTLTARGLPSRGDAYRMIHRPLTVAEARAGRDRIAYDELLRLQLVIAMSRASLAAEPGVAHPRGARAGVHTLLAAQPFQATLAQRRAMNEIARDMESPEPMHRLLQGEVGSGKSLVDTAAVAIAVTSGHQAALLAPTETLATQHYLETSKALAGIPKPDGSPIVVAALTPKVTGKARKEVLAGLADGTIDVVVGTSAVLAPAVTFASLSLAVIDEQHRFGVEQRAALRGKGNGVVPDTLYSTATPIPRTAAMTTFGDLTVSVLDELPPGRTPIVTTQLVAAGTTSAAVAPWDAVRAQVAAGRQAFVVVPLASSAKAEDLAAHKVADGLAAGALQGLRIGVTTGKDAPALRAETMAAFAAGDLDVLVSTTVIEVGVNVPNATVMVVLGADRFGIAQLHQLRGRVGRGEHPGHCFLVADPSTKAGKERIAALVATTDGFALAELDAANRGIGHVTGSTQSGAGSRDLLVADVVADADLVAWAREDAAGIVEGDPRLARRPGLATEVSLAVDEEAAAWLRTA